MAHEAAPTPAAVAAGAIELRVNVGSQLAEVIVVRASDDAALLARNFCVKHNLSERKQVKLQAMMEAEQRTLRSDSAAAAAAAAQAAQAAQFKPAAATSPVMPSTSPVMTPAHASRIGFGAPQQHAGQSEPATGGAPMVEGSPLALPDNSAMGRSTPPPPPPAPVAGASALPQTSPVAAPASSDDSDSDSDDAAAAARAQLYSSIQRTAKQQHNRVRRENSFGGGGAAGATAAAAAAAAAAPSSSSASGAGQGGRGTARRGQRRRRRQRGGRSSAAGSTATRARGGSTARRVTRSRSGGRRRAPALPPAANSNAAVRRSGGGGGGAASRRAAPASAGGKPKKPSRLSAKERSKVFENLYQEAQRREERRRQEVATAQALERDEMRARPALAASGGDQGDTAVARTMSVEESMASGQKLYEKGRAMLERRKQAAIESKELQTMQEEWLCPTCGHSNNGMSEYCENVSKIGKRSAPKHAFSDKKMQRVCGQPKPAMFKPTISQLARKMSRTNSMQDNVARYVEERQRREREAKEREQAAGADLSFRPTINARSKQLAAKKRAQAASERGSVAGDHASTVSAAPELHEKLYQEAQRRRERAALVQMQADEQYKFRPDIGVDKLRPNPDSSHDALFERLHGEAEERTRRLEEARAAALRVDPKTQQPLFHPQTGRSPLFDRNTAELPIGDYLFASRHEFDDMKERLRDMYSSHLRSLSNRKYTSSRSRKLLNALNRKAYAFFFAQLRDGPQSGVGEEAEEAPAIAGAVHADGVASPGAASGGGASGAGAGASPEATPPADDAVEGSVTGSVAMSELTSTTFGMSLASTSTIPTIEDVSGLVHCQTAPYELLGPNVAPVVQPVLQALGSKRLTFAEFVSTLEPCMSDVGGAAHLYLVARRRNRGSGHGRASAGAGAGGGGGDAQSMIGSLADEEEVSAECTFKPQISRASQRIMKQRGGGPAFERLLEKGELYKQRLDELRAQALEEELEQCTFKPHVNSNTGSMSSEYYTLLERATAAEAAKRAAAGASAEEERSN